MNKKEQIRQEIINNSPKEQINGLLDFLDNCQYDSEWAAFTTCHWKKIGVYSYQSVRVWTFKYPNKIITIGAYL